MTEENVTKTLLNWLIKRNWQIVCFDFPQSGTGILLHPNNKSSEKNKDSINVDIVAVRDNICVFLENKNRFCYSDYKKINFLINENEYSKSIENLLSDYTVDKIYYGIGIPSNKHSKQSKDSEKLVDFILGVEETGGVSVLYNPKLVNF